MLHRYEFRAMGTDIEVKAAPHTGAALPETCFQQAEELFYKYERVMTRFDEASELARVNRWAGSWVQVSPLLFDVIRIAVQAAEHTAGLFDPTIGRVLCELGYDRPFEALPSDRAPSDVTRRRVSWKDIELDEEALTIRIPEGVALDLGGIGKGYAVDAVAEHCARQGPVLVNAGGDIRTIGTPSEESAWTIGVASPFEQARDLVDLRLTDAAVATSTTMKRRWQQGGRTFHHLVDPRTDRPAQSNLVSVTVVAPSATEAEVHAKAALLLGAARARGYFAARPALAAIIVTVGGEIRMTESMRPLLSRLSVGSRI